MILIASAAYVGPELAAEFGAIPPCMLPLGNKPLFERQINALHKQFPGEPIVLSLPQSYEPSTGNAKLLSGWGVQVISVPDGLSLTDSLLFVINTAGEESSLLRILHGDTLIDDFPLAHDVLAVARTQNDYAWEIETLDVQEEIVWCGYFSFASVKLFTRYLALSRGDFVAAIRSYDEQGRLERHYIAHWFDLGHINTYFASRAMITTERSFNALNIEEGMVWKSGLHHRKIEAEINWYLNVPPKIRLKTPQLLDYGVTDGQPYYTLEYLNLTPLNELFVHGRNPTFFWSRIFAHCDKFFIDCIDLAAGGLRQGESLNNVEVEKDMHDLLVAKTWSRLEEFAEQSATDLNMPWCLNNCATPSLNDVARKCISAALDQSSIAGVMHGDFCFSNILFDSRADAIKVIDPRGISHAGKFTIFGNMVYDLAKLTHSVIGLYDFIVTGVCRLEVIAKGNLVFEIFVDKRTIEIQQLFLERSFAGGKLRPRDVMPQVILLFLSMLPLHADNPERQLALMANALRLYSEFEKQL